MKKNLGKFITPLLAVLLAIAVFYVRRRMFFAVDSSGNSYNLSMERLAVVFVLSSFVALFFLPEKLKTPERMFLILGLGAGAAFALVTPLGQEADGYTHLIRSMDISYGNIFSSFVDLTHPGGYVTVPTNLEDIGYVIFPPSNEGTLLSYVNNLKTLHFSSETVLAEYSEGAFTFFYWPQGLGLFLGRVAGLSVYYTGILVHFLNLFTYIFFTYQALKIMPVGKNMLMVLAVSPLALFQAASLSPDALLNGLCFLFVALCFRYAYCEEKIRWRNIILLSVLLAVIFICKYVYICLGLLVLLIPARKFGGLKKWIPALIAGVIPLVIVILLSLFRVRGILEVSESVMAEGSEENATQIGFILAHPMELLFVIRNTFYTNFSYYIEWMNTLGSLNFQYRGTVVVGPMLFTAIAFLDTNEIQERIKVKDRVIIALTAVLNLLALMMAMYIFDSRLNALAAPCIEGVQGRYLFPFLILPFIALGSGKIRNGVRNFSFKCIASEGILLIASFISYVDVCYH